MKIVLKLQFLTCKKYSEHRSTVKNCNFSRLQFFKYTFTVIPLHIFAVQGACSFLLSCNFKKWDWVKCYVHFLRCPCTSWLLRWLAEEAQLSSIVFVRLLLFGSHVTVIYCEQNSLNYIHAWHYVHYIKCKKGHWTPQGLQ